MIITNEYPQILSWLLYKYYQKVPPILADEMGLGKTIQIISLLNILYHKHSLWPFLVVAPNATILNWYREFAKWAPQLRVVPYMGSAASRKIIRDYELFHDTNKSNHRNQVSTNGGKRLKCHVVVTSYESVMAEPFVFKNIPWEVCVVDEAHRLKNDDCKLFDILKQLTVAYKILLTGGFEIIIFLC